VTTAKLREVEADERPWRDYEGFFTCTFSRVAGMAGGIVGRDGGEDVAIEALARAFARWRSVEVMDNPEAWVMRVATNLALDQVRRRSAYAVAPAARDLQETATEREIVRSSVSKLPRRQRQVVALRYLADMSEDDVARVLNLSNGSVKTHLHRALAGLRVSLSARQEGQGSATHA
jgi:RNA polymerase sigma-70 factor (ECF subfamily)